MNLSPYQAKYFAFQLSRRFPSGSSERFNRALMDAQVDLNPHQVEAALFAVRSPLSKGAILADEVGLGKTIEAGILLSQFWAERKRKMIIVCPANLRKQWSQELKDKFFLDSVILEKKSYRNFSKAGYLNPFNQPTIIITSYQYAAAMAEKLQLISWDLAVMDEAHRLRNVYKSGNKLGPAIKQAFSFVNKLVLLTATPLQNSLLELYGLVSFIDEHLFGDLKSFKAQFIRVNEEANFEDLRQRLQSICIRSLRKHVQEYVPYTKRIPLTFKFQSTDQEHELYERVSEYLQKDLLFALPPGQRHLMTLILRKLLASSSYAIAGTLTSLIRKLQLVIEENRQSSLDAKWLDDDDLYNELEEDIEDADAESEEQQLLTQEDIAAIKEEIIELKGFLHLAESIVHNEKGEKLKTALKEGFNEMQPGSPVKALIFTESRRTQQYLLQLLEKEYPGQVMIFNGTNTDADSARIYEAWKQKHQGTDKISGSPTADKRAALVENFRDNATIMIATEAAAEGINLQFCSLLINYDLPWNPQRIEQRIGRCHRYGQKFDVVVVNFINTRNEADVRVFQILDVKLKLFDGVFGASDEVLGAIDSGVDFERRIAGIIQSCRSAEEIEREFNKFDEELDQSKREKMNHAHRMLFENFDVDVVDKLRVRLAQSKEYISKYEQWLWQITRYELHDFAIFNDVLHSFRLHSLPYSDLKSKLPLETYRLGKNVEEAHTYRLGHALAEKVMDVLQTKQLFNAALIFDLTGFNGNVAILEKLKGKHGCLSVHNLTIESFEVSDFLLLAGCVSDGISLEEDQVNRMLQLPVIHSTQLESITVQQEIKKEEDNQLKVLLKRLKEQDSGYMSQEIEKLYKWADDKIAAAEMAIKETKARIKELNRDARKCVDTIEQLDLQKKLQELNSQQKKQRQEIFEVEDEIAFRRDEMIKGLEIRMKQQITQTHLFTINWELV